MHFERKEQKIKIGMKDVKHLTNLFGTPLYVYDENTIRDRCQILQQFCKATKTKIYYSAKANTNIALMRIIRSEGIHVDAMSLGELYLEQLAGFTPKEILFLTNNSSKEAFKQVASQGIPICVDAISQLKDYCEVLPNSKVLIRLNIGEGAGHHQKVITVGQVKFGIDSNHLAEAFEVAKNKNCTISGFVVHIGSFYLDYQSFHQNVLSLLELVVKYPEIEYIDFGGGFGIPYDRQNQSLFPFEEYEPIYSKTILEWLNQTQRKVEFAIEPGRFLVAEGGICLSKVMSIKNNYGIDFIGCDMGFNTLIRPALYNAYHEIINATRDTKEEKAFDITGNLCESGDILGKQRMLPVDTQEGDILLVRDTGAYGYAMSSNYNSFGRPAEILIDTHGTPKLIRKSETLEQLIKHQVY